MELPVHQDPGKGMERAANLHEQMAADIERARAELREKSGRWKAR